MTINTPQPSTRAVEQIRNIFRIIDHGVNETVLRLALMNLYNIGIIDGMDYIAKQISEQFNAPVKP